MKLRFCNIWDFFKPNADNRIDISLWQVGANEAFTGVVNWTNIPILQMYVLVLTYQKI